MLDPAPTLTQRAAPALGQMALPRVDVLLVVGVLIAAVVVLSVVVLLVRRKLLSEGGDATGSAAGVLESLRQMRNDGRLTEAEFQAAKARLGAGLRAAAGAGARGTRPARGGDEGGKEGLGQPPPGEARIRRRG